MDELEQQLAVFTAAHPRNRPDRGATALEGEAEGWRSLTCHDATHQMICPECQKGLEGEDRNPIP